MDQRPIITWFGIIPFLFVSPVSSTISASPGTENEKHQIVVSDNRVILSAAFLQKQLRIPPNDYSGVGIREQRMHVIGANHSKLSPEKVRSDLLQGRT